MHDRTLCQLALAAAFAAAIVPACGSSDTTSLPGTGGTAGHSTTGGSVGTAGSAGAGGAGVGGTSGTGGAGGTSTVVDPLRGRRYWSAALGYIVSGGNPWVRKHQYTLTPSTGATGTAVTSWDQWNGPGEPTKSVVGATGPCNGAASCDIYQPVANLSGSWDGTYSLSDDVLTFQWSNGNTDSWTIDSVRDGALGRMVLLSADYPGSDPNVGKGYGSTQDWTVYKTAGAVDSLTATFMGTYDLNVSGGASYDQPWGLDMAGFNPHDASHPKALHNLHPDSHGSSGACPDTYETVLGNIYHLWVTNSNRVLPQNNYFRCLILPDGNGCYHLGLHMAVLDQVIDDNNNMVGVVGIEASSSGGYTYGRIDALAP